ncbi:MAG: hypothetical protein J5741_04875 [Bacteroidales bacterium]|nr:hypothetical protein [Bacteroidales bacterium]
MKKFLCISAFALFLIVGGTSCNKTCNCKTYLDGEVVTESSFDNEGGKKCSDYNTVMVIDGHKTGMECH